MITVMISFLSSENNAYPNHQNNVIIHARGCIHIYDENSCGKIYYEEYDVVGRDRTRTKKLFGSHKTS